MSRAAVDGERFRYLERKRAGQARYRARHPERVVASQQRFRFAHLSAEYRETLYRWRKGFKGCAWCMYKKMHFRVKNVSSYKRFSVDISRGDFLTKILSDPAYAAKHAAWVASGYQPKLAPSIDRIDPARGYSADNIQVLTRSENSRKRASDNRLAKNNTKK